MCDEEKIRTGAGPEDENEGNQGASNPYGFDEKDDSDEPIDIGDGNPIP